MRAINHALTGSIIGLTVTAPIAAVPLAVISHFICDMIPHYGTKKSVDDVGASIWFKTSLLVDALLCFSLVIILAVLQPPFWQLAAVCAFLAAAPDFLWLPRYIAVLQHRTWRPSRFSKFAVAIQWYEKPSGAFVEVAWGVACLFVLQQLL
jgi:hypothetical protein